MIFNFKIFLFCIVYLSLSSGFKPMSSKAKLNILSMGGGRSPAEKGATTRTMFKDLRNKFNEAAKAPGFFETADGPADIDLYCKSNKDGTQIGDDPFSQFVQLVMLKKGIRYNIKPTLPNAKPDWLVSKHEGKMPAIVYKGESIVDSIAIAEYLEKKFPHTSLTRQGAYSYQEVLEKIADFFPSLAAFIKNKDSSKDASLKQKVEDQLNLIDELLRTTPGQYLCGIELTLADLYLLPQLFHAMVTLERFKGIEIYHVNGTPTRPALENYLARMLDLEEFNNKRAYYNIDQVVYGWKVARGEL